MGRRTPSDFTGDSIATGVTGSERVRIDQNGAPKFATLQEIANLAPPSAPPSGSVSASDVLNDSSVPGITVASALDGLQGVDLANAAAAEAYADAGDATTLASANAHSDANDVTTLDAAEDYADAGDAATLASANAHSDAGDAATLASANAHSDANDALQLHASQLDTDGTLAANSDAKVASQKATKTYVDAAKASAIATAEAYADVGDALQLHASQLDTDGALTANSDAKVASQKATKTYADTKVPLSYLDTDTALAANSDVKVATQKATKAYADTKVPLSYLDTDGTLAANSDVKVATQKAVKTYVDQIIAAQDAMVFKGVIDASANPNYPAADRGHTYRISVAGKIGGASGTNVEVGDLILCLTDGTLAGTQAAVGTSWTIAQSNLDGAVIGPASAVSGDFATFSGTSGKLIQDSGYSFDIDGALTANSDVRIGSQKAVKTYVDATATGILAIAAATYVELGGDTMTGALQVPAGLVGTPGLRVGAATTGFFLSTSLRVAVAGVESVRFSALGVGVGGDPAAGSEFYAFRSAATAGFVADGDNGGAALFRGTSYNTSVGGGTVISMRRARGTLASPALVIQNDQVGEFRAAVWTSGSTFSTIGQVLFNVIAASPSASDMQTRMVVNVAAASSVIATEIYRADHATGLTIASVGINVPAGTVGAPSVQVGGATTGLFLDTSLRVALGGAECVRFNASGIGIGVDPSSTYSFISFRTGINLGAVFGESATGFLGLRASADSSGPAMFLRKARGTLAAPALPNQSDELAVISASYWTSGTVTGGASVVTGTLNFELTEPVPSATLGGTRMRVLLASVGGVSRTELLKAEHATGLTIASIGVNVPAGLLATPSVQISATNIGFYHSGGVIGVSYGGVLGARFNADGIGIGASPSASNNLIVTGPGQLGGSVSASRATLWDTNGVLTLKNANNSVTIPFIMQNLGVIAINQGLRMRWQLGTANVVGSVDAFQVNILSTEDWLSAANESAVVTMSVALDGVLTETMRLNPATGLNLMGNNVVVDQNRIIRPRSYTVATLPTITTTGLIYVSDAAAIAVLAYSDGTDWRRVDDHQIVSATIKYFDGAVNRQPSSDRDITTNFSLIVDEFITIGAGVSLNIGANATLKIIV